MDDFAMIYEYVEWAVSRKGNRPRTMYQYQLKLEDLVRFVAPTRLASVTASELDEWLRRETNGKANAPATQQRDLVILRNFFGFAQRRGWISVDPTVELIAPKVRNQNPHPISDELWLAWYNAHHRDQDALLFVGLGYLLGLRRAEILRVTGAMVTPRSLQIAGLERKGGGDDVLPTRDLVEIVALGLPRLLPDKGDRFLALLSERAKRTSGLLLDWRDARFQGQRRHALPEGENDPQWVYRHIDRWARQARLEAFKPHDLRHSFATNLLRCDIPLALASRLCNHSDFATTSRYIKLGNSELRQLVRSKRSEQAERPVLTRFA